MTNEAGDLRRRLRAARELAGHESVGALATKIKASHIRDRGLGKTVLYDMEAGRRVPDLMEIYAIAEACGVPIGWFAVDINAAVMSATVTDAVEIITAMLADAAQGAPPDADPQDLPPAEDEPDSPAVKSG